MSSLRLPDVVFSRRAGFAQEPLSPQLGLIGLVEFVTHGLTPVAKL
jgi:hypothetical protein